MLIQTLKKLEPALRETFVLCELVGLKYQEIAEIQGISVGRVGSRLTEARLSLAKLMNEHGWRS